ncbi:ATP-binding protein [Micromonospora sp. R77]|uniref:ATP-binding protein n=1 Tax=Micromonospora sp. R77 TaxID=2925836 RepID=UPI001F61225E|nr:ATP-binding protein [Micromonospora sp. R77]MCI4062516.1 ATP-binding protein [Micromonospora sp. R77]
MTNQIERPDAPRVPDVHNGTIMPTDVRCLVELDDASALATVTGVLDPVGVGSVRDALLTRLWERPGPVIADLSGLRVPDPTDRSVFDEVHRVAGDWPAAGLLVVDPAGGWPGASTPVCASLDEARAAVATPPAAMLGGELLPAVEAAREARALVTDACLRWGMPELAESACIAVTEMVNNVVAHARTPMTVRVAPGDHCLHLAVRDHSRRHPAFAGVAPVNSAGGRGLLLIDTVARRWGSTPLPDGKVVWCVLHTEDEDGCPR